MQWHPQRVARDVAPLSRAFRVVAAGLAYIVTTSCGSATPTASRTTDAPPPRASEAIVAPPVPSATVAAPPASSSAPIAARHSPGPELLLQGNIRPAGIAVAGDSIYVTDVAASTVVRIPVSGGDPRVIAKGLGFPRHIVAQSGAIFFADRERIAEVAPDGGRIRDLVNDAADDSVAVDESSVYWIGGPNDLLKRTLHRRPLGDGPARSLCVGDGLPQAVVVDATGVYFGSAVGGAITKCPLPRGAMVTLVPGPVQGTNATNLHLAVFAGTVYWSDANAHAVSSVPAAGGSMTRVSVIDGEQPRGLAVDDRDIVWATSEGTIHRLARTRGATVETLAKGQGSCVEAALSPTHVYWACYDEAGGSVSRFPRSAQ